MRFILFLYLLIVGFTGADAERYYPLRKPAAPFRSAPPFRSAAPFPSLPAAVHWQDSADVWRKSLGAAKTGGTIPLPSGSVIPKLKIHSNIPIKMNGEPLNAVNYYKKKFLHGG